MSHTAVVAAGAVVALLSELVVVTFWAMVVLTVAYMLMCQGPLRLAIEKQRSRRELACCVSLLLQLVWGLLILRLAGCCPLRVASQERCEATVPGCVAACTRPARMLMLHRWTQVLMSGLWLVVMLRWLRADPVVVLLCRQRSRRDLPNCVSRLPQLV